MIGYCPLASGSKGNAIFVGSKTTKLLIDIGISYRALKERLEKIGLQPEMLDAVLVTHEHSDHIKGLEQLVKRHNIPILCNSDTAKAILRNVEERPMFKIFTTGESFTFGDVEIHPFSVQHDTCDPVMFTLQMDGIKLGVCTDIGFVTTLVKTHLHECDYLFIEANHDEEMVHASNRSQTYKSRVLSRLGHLSNKSAGALIKEVDHQGLKHVYLAHLSSECNHPKVALMGVQEMLEKRSSSLEISIAYQDSVSDPIHW